MELAHLFLGTVLGTFIGFIVAQLIRTKKVGKALEELDVNDPQFEGKLSIISKFNGSGF